MDYILDEKTMEVLKAAGPIFFVTPTMGRAIGLETVLPDYHIITARYADSIPLLEAKGVGVFSVGRDIKNSGKLLMEPEVLEYIARSCAGRRANILTFKPSPMLEMACRQHGFRYLGNSASLNRDFEDKVKFALFTEQLGISNAGSRVVRIGEDPDALLSEFDFLNDRKYIVQFPHGYSGNSTFLVPTPERLREIFRENAGWKVKVSEFRPGEAYTLDACVSAGETLVSQPIFQITGFSRFNRQELGTCGNDYARGRALGAEARRLMEESITIVADRLQGLGYRGILGFDFVVGPSGADLIEVNPRLVGSVPVITKLQLASGQIPFLLSHILSFLGYDLGAFPFEGRREFDFSQLILRNTAEAPALIEAAPKSGIYGLEEGELVFRREAYAADDLGGGEFFLECAPAGETIDPDMEYANIQVPYGIMETDKCMRGDFLFLVDAVSKRIILR